MSLVFLMDDWHELIYRDTYLRRLVLSIIHSLNLHKINIYRQILSIKKTPTPKNPILEDESYHFAVPPQFIDMSPYQPLQVRQENILRILYLYNVRNTS